MKKKKGKTPMERLTAGYEDFIKGKSFNSNGEVLFEKVIKKAVSTKKQRGSK